jgi:hypothetical protein
MCQSLKDGGVRCASHTAPQYLKAKLDFLAGDKTDPVAIKSLREAAFRHASSESGPDEIDLDAVSLFLSTTPPEIELAFMLMTARQEGVKARQVAVETARNIAHIRKMAVYVPNQIAPDLDEDPDDNYDENFNAAEWLSRHDPSLTLAELWTPLLRETNEENRHRARDILANLTIEDFAAYRTVEDSKKDIVDSIAAGLNTNSDELDPAIMDKLDKNKLGYELSKEKRDMIKKIINRGDQGDTQASWWFANMKEGGLAALNLESENLKVSFSRQNRFEPLACAYIQSKSPENVQVLQLSRKVSKLEMRFNTEDGSIYFGGTEKDHTKSADIAIVETDPNSDKVHVLVVAHKYAKLASGGGAQDNQKNDAIQFFEGACLALEKEENKDIPALRALASEKLGREVKPEDFSWTPALSLDGEYFVKAEEELRAVNQKATRANFFIGNTEELVARLNETPFLGSKF